MKNFAIAMLCCILKKALEKCGFAFAASYTVLNQNYLIATFNLDMSSVLAWDDVPSLQKEWQNSEILALLATTKGKKAQKSTKTLYDNMKSTVRPLLCQISF